ncbi:hypothetical protein B0H12DRAFT_1240054 [Mycena haematopus]|nr:hypothetical protein B0H12DRAFT_1240054 [Mycena haematopus]
MAGRQQTARMNNVRALKICGFWKSTGVPDANTGLPKYRQLRKLGVNGFHPRSSTYPHPRSLDRDAGTPPKPRSTAQPSSTRYASGSASDRLAGVRARDSESSSIVPTSTSPRCAGTQASASYGSLPLSHHHPPSRSSAGSRSNRIGVKIDAATCEKKNVFKSIERESGRHGGSSWHGALSVAQSLQSIPFSA